ncbi:MAG TPA: RsmE family RNA methyltransferase [Planctomycetaceae bacterium]|nr:RsmE family RNA methyltransferase [Planctomycetaceae bacterium]
MHRYFLDDDLMLGKIRISGAEAHHLIHVMRTAVGESVELFDGRGNVARGELVELRRNEALIDAGEVQHTTRPSGPVLISAVPKGDRFRWLVEKATELGVSRLIPVTTELSVVAPRESKIEKQEQTVVAACKQSGRNWLMQVDTLRTLEQATEENRETVLKYVADPAGESLPATNGSAGDSPVFVIGPEGGLTSSELDRLEARGYEKIRLGPSILRIETAAVSLAGWWCLSRMDLQ